MQCWIVEGHRGAGKSLYAVMKARDYLDRGRTVVSNLTLHLDRLMGARNRMTYTKIPGVPRAVDLYGLGEAYPGAGNESTYDEKKNGLAIFDEAGMWLNTREWNEKGRKEVYAWMTQSRKFGFDLLLLIQDWEALDAQIRRALVDIHVSAMTTDRIKIPFLPVKAPKFHVFVGHYKGPGGMLTGREWTRGKGLYRAYNTAEKIKVDETLLPDGGVIDARGCSSGLSAWHLVGRYLPPSPRPSLWVGFLLKWLIAWPALVAPRARSADGATTARQAFLDDLSILLPLFMPHAAREVVARANKIEKTRPLPLSNRYLGCSHDAYRLARYRRAVMSDHPLP